MNPQLATAAASAADAIRAGAREPELYATLGWYQIHIGDVDSAQQMFASALTLAPTDPEALTGMGHCLRQQGKLRDAILHCDAAIRANPDFVDAWLERGFIFASGGSMQSAKECYQKVVGLDPTNAAAHAGIASIMARDGDSTEGRAHAARALLGDSGNAIATAALATMQIESGEVEAARGLVEPLVTTLPEPSADRSMLFALLGDACDKLGNPAKAYDSYARSKADFAAIHGERVAGRPSHREYIDGISAQLSGMVMAKSGLARPENAAEKHLFLLGYPRSGNTLVENILASLPNVVALEERPTLVEADMAFLTSDDGLARFAALSEAELQPYAQWTR
jgi:tetratricopeptide (TPR) repeat protein